VLRVLQRASNLCLLGIFQTEALQTVIDLLAAFLACNYEKIDMLASFNHF